VPLPASTKEPRYEEDCARAAAKAKERREGRKEELLASARPFSFQEAVKKKPPPSEPELQRPFRAKLVPRAVHEPLWEIIQQRESGRQERLSREAQTLYQKRQLPPHLAEEENRRTARREQELARIEREVLKDNTFRPKVRASLPPDFGALQRRFEKGFEEARLSNPHRKVQHKEFALRTDQLRGQQRPAQEQIDMVEADIARDQLVLPEQRWPYASTRAKVPPREIPDFKSLHESPRMPQYRTTTSEQLRRACVEESALKEQLRQRRDEQREAKRLAALREVSKEVAKALGNGSARLNKLNKLNQQHTQKERFKADAREKQVAADARIAEIRAKVDARPFLFERQSADANAMRAKQAQYDKFGALIREHGLGDLLEKMPYT